MTPVKNSAALLGTADGYIIGTGVPQSAGQRLFTNQGMKPLTSLTRQPRDSTVGLVDRPIQIDQLIKKETIDCDV